MVLDDASSRESDDFSESAPASDSDPYASTSDAISQPLSLPRPIPILGPLVGYNQQFIAKAIQLRIQSMQEMLERPVTTDEATAMAYWTARQISITSYGQPIGILAGWWRAYNTSNTFKFPFYTPKPETFNPEAFPSAKRPWISGPRAILAWQASRVGIYAMVGSWIGGLIFGSYALSVVGVGEVSDKRLRAYVEAVRKRAQRTQGSIFAPGPQRQPQGGFPGAEQGAQRGRPPVVNDDASPTSGAYGDTDDTGNINAYGPSQNENQNTGVREARSREQRAPTADNSRISDREPRSFDDDFDDASPTGGRGAAADTGGSAWERIRKQASTQGSGPHESSWPSGSGPGRPQSSSQDSSWSRTRASSQNNSSSGDSFSFSSEEEERQVARTEAQKEFDDRVDRERRGGDFSSGGGDQRRW